jgi:hypothetical protein
MILSMALLATTRLSAMAPDLRVSDNHRFLVQTGGRPFFWLADTAWEIFHRLKLEEADRYFRDRAKKGFTVVQAVAVSELDGSRAPNAYGDLPFTDGDPGRPVTNYWDTVDAMVDRANALGLVVGLLPCWGGYWHDGNPPMFNPQNARTYGEWIGRRYRDRKIVWILGGDRHVENDLQRETIRAMAAGLRAGDGGRHLMTFHPRGGASSADDFHSEPWLDFNMRQSGHDVNYNLYVEGMTRDYARTPVKPVLDGEPIYENHPIAFRQDTFGHSTAADVRRAFYWDVFSGGCGHTYGNHAMWQMAAPGHDPINNPLTTWVEALDSPGASQMGFGRQLIESRPFLSRVPDESIIVPAKVVTSVPGRGIRRFTATRDSEGSYAMVYVPLGREFMVRMDCVKGPKVRAWWFDPRTGKSTKIGEFPASWTRSFISPDPGELLDWVLVLDDASRGFAAPGSKRQ